MDDAIAQLAKMMRARRAAGVAPYTLLLGSSLSLTPAVRRAVCDSEAWEAFWETVARTSPEERRALMHEPLSQLDLQAGCDALAQLVGTGYFNVVLTLNVDDALDNALKALPVSEYRVWVHGEVSSREIVTALDRPTPRIKVVKLRGDVNAYKLPLTPEATFEFPDDLEDAVMRFLHHDTVIVGDLPFDDDVHRCIRGGDGALWVVTAEGNGFLDRAKRIRKVGEVIAATEFNAFFTTLAEELGLGEAEDTAPEVTFVPPEQRANPYRGLEPFEPEHARYFFGREVLTEILVERLRQDRFLAVLGASGSGKSSVVRAGVLPVLAQGKLPGSESWPVLVIKPGQNPQEALAGALAATVSAARSAGAVDFARLQETRQEVQERLLREESALHELVAEVVAQGSDDRRAVVVIDQFEELFTLCPFEQRQRFIDALLYAVGQANGHTTVLLTLRADFVAQCTAYPDLSDLIASHQVWVRAMDDEGLRASIERPIWLTGMQYEAGLVPLILADVGREPGALPLLEDALWSLFEYCKAGDEVIEVREYREIGGVQGALAKRADDVYGTLTAEEQEYTRRILLRLVEMREGQEATRRRAALDELVTATEERDPVEKVVQRLTDARLLTTTQDEETGQRVVDISHEVLIRGWPRLREWLEESREDLVTRQRLREAAAEWEHGERHESYLYRGARLAKVMEWRVAHEGELSDSERAFLDASVEVEERAAREEEARRQRELEQARALAEEQRQRAEEQARTARRLRLLTRVLAAVFLLAVGGGVYAGIQQQRAQKNEQFAKYQLRLSTSRELAAAAISNLDIDPERSILLALQAVPLTYSVDKTVTSEAEDALHRSVQASRVQLTLSGHTHPVLGVAFSPDGTRLATASADYTAKVWDAASGGELLTLSGHNDWVYDVAFSPNGTRLATASADSTAKVWGANSGQELLTLSGHTDDVNGVAFSPDGTRLATASADMMAKVWDVASGQELLTLSGHTGDVNGVAFNPDGTHLATVSDDQTVKVWDATSGEELLTLSGHTYHVDGVAFSPDGTRLATVSKDQTVKVWDAASGEELLTLFGHTTSVFDVAFSPDGRRLATASADRTAKVWDAASGQELLTLSGHGGWISGVAFSSDGTRLATASFDRTVRVWNTSASQELLTLSGHDGWVYGVAFSPDGTRLASAGEDRTAKVWDAASGQELLTLSGHTDWIYDVAFSPDGTRLATVGEDATAKVWDAASGQELLTLSGHTGWVYGVAFSPDGSRLVSAGARAVKMWDAVSGKELLTLSDHDSDLFDVAFSPDGTRLATASADYTAKVWDAASGQELLTLSGHTGRVCGITFNPDETRLATASEDGTVKIWDAASGKELLTLSGHTAAVWDVAFSSDGTRLATASFDRTVKVWDAASGERLLTLSGPTAAVSGVVFSPHGKHLATANGDGTVRVYTLDIEELMRLAQQRVTRSLRPEECQEYLHQEQCPTTP